MPTLTHLLRHISGDDHDRCLSRSRGHCQHWRQYYHQSPLCCDIDGLAGEEEKFAKLAEYLNKASTAYGIISAEKTKLMTNNTSGTNIEIKENGQNTETVTSFKYLGSVITHRGSKPEILSRIAQTTAALTRLKPVWNDRSICLSSKIRLMCSLVTSIFLCACASLTLTAELQRRIQAMEMRRYRKILRICYKDHATNEEVGVQIQQAIGPHEDLLRHRTEMQTAVVWTCLPFIRSGQNHLARLSERWKKTRQTEEEVGRQQQGMDRPRVRQVPEGSGEQRKMEETGCEIICGAPTTPTVKG